jgi:hypothetical protein
MAPRTRGFRVERAVEREIALSCPCDSSVMEGVLSSGVELPYNRNVIATSTPFRSRKNADHLHPHLPQV